MQYLTELDWHTLRLGAFHVLVAAGERSVDTREALLNRFQNVLFHKVYEDEPTYEKFFPQLDDAAFLTLKKRARKFRPSAAAAILPTESENPWFFTTELWQVDRRLLAPGIGTIAEEHAHRYLELGQKLGLFTPTNALSERGELLRAFYARSHSGIDCESPEPNPFDVDTLASRIIFMDALLREDALFPLMMMEFWAHPEAGVATAFRDDGGKPVPELLMAVAQRLYDILSVDPDIHTALELKHLRAYIDSIAVKKNHLNQAYPRMEFAVDLRLVERSDVGRKRTEPFYRSTDAAGRFVGAFTTFHEDPTAAQNALDDAFFGGMAATYGLAVTRAKSDDEKLLWFARGYKIAKRLAGFTPGRSAAFAGCLLALENGRLIELSEMFEAAYRSAKGPHGAYVGFSGGSRFDREFLIRVDDRLEDALCRVVESEQLTPQPPRGKV